MEQNNNAGHHGRGAPLPALAPALRRRAYAYGFALFAEVVLIVGCFCWMSESEPCKVQDGVPPVDDMQQLPEGQAPGIDASHGPQQPCDEATYLFCVFYLGLAKDLAFFLAGLKTEHLTDVPDRIRSVFLQYVGSLFFFGFASAVASSLYLMQPADHLARKVLYIAGGALPNATIAVDCALQCLTAWRRGFRTLFPDVQEIRPFKYEELDDKNIATTWYLKECSICLDNFEGEDSVVRLPCGHLFHTDCVVGWLRQTMTCPVRCRLGFFMVALPPGSALEAQSEDDLDDHAVLQVVPQARRQPVGQAIAHDGVGAGVAGAVAFAVADVEDALVPEGDPVDGQGEPPPTAAPWPQPPPARQSQHQLMRTRTTEEDHSNEVPPVMLGVPDHSHHIPFVD